MKKVIRFTVCLTLCFLVTGVPAFATENALQLDDTGIYQGMTRSYSQGYTPLEKNGSVILTLPLVASQPLRGNELVATFDLGVSNGSPFQAVNLIKTISLGTYEATNGKSKALYLITATIPLAAQRNAGAYPIVIEVTAETTSGVDVDQTFSIYASVSGTPQKKSASSVMPQLVVTSAVTDPSTVLAGAPFHFSVTFSNMGSSQAITNMKVSISDDSAELFFPNGSSGSYYIPKIGAGSSVTLTADMESAATAKPVPHQLKLLLNYQVGSTTITGEEDLLVAVNQSEKLDFDAPNLPTQVHAGEEVSVSINAMNLGTGSVSNVMASAEVPGLRQDRTAFLGNIDSGSSANADLYLFVEGKTMGSDNTTASADGDYGDTTGKIVITYEDAYGKTYTKDFKVSTTILPPVIEKVTSSNNKQRNAVTRYWLIAVLILALVIIGLIVLFYWRKRRAQVGDNESISGRDK